MSQHKRLARYWVDGIASRNSDNYFLFAQSAAKALDEGRQLQNRSFYRLHNDPDFRILVAGFLKTARGQNTIRDMFPGEETIRDATVSANKSFNSQDNYKLKTDILSARGANAVPVANTNQKRRIHPVYMTSARDISEIVPHNENKFFDAIENEVNLRYRSADVRERDNQSVVEFCDKNRVRRFVSRAREIRAGSHRHGQSPPEHNFGAWAKLRDQLKERESRTKNQDTSAERPKTAERLRDAGLKHIDNLVACKLFTRLSAVLFFSVVATICLKLGLIDVGEFIPFIKQVQHFD